MKPAKRELNSLRPIIFDFGGVLIDWNPRYLYLELFDNDQDAVEAFLNEIGFAEWNAEQDRGRPFAEAVQVLSQQFPQYANLIEAYDARWRESLSGAIQPTVDILRILRDAGYSLFGLSNWSLEKFELVRPEYPFFAWFQSIIISGEVKVAKPDRRIFALMLDRVGRTASECIYIDDSPVNVSMARELGFAAIHYESPEGLRGALREMGIVV